MVNIPIIINLLIAATGLVSGHPGEHHDASSIAAELQRRDAHAAEIQRGLDNCQTHPTYRTLKRRGLTRRYEKAQQLRRDRGIDTSSKLLFVILSHLGALILIQYITEPYKTSFHSRRDLASLQHFESLNHNLTNKGYNVDTDPSTLFASFKNSSCILTPETTQGPYWVLVSRPARYSLPCYSISDTTSQFQGEYFRNDVVENQPGIPVHIEYQYIDISTCNAVNGIYQETWQANATGVYGGVEDTSNPANLNATWLRGISGVDSDGIGYFGKYDSSRSQLSAFAPATPPRRNLCTLVYWEMNRYPFSRSLLRTHESCECRLCLKTHLRASQLMKLT